jgi:hypothetical protein
MATCPSCDKEVRDGDWTCGGCGMPVAGAGAPAGAGHGTSYTPPQDAYVPPAVYGAPAAAVAPRRGLSRTAVTVLVLALIAVVAIVAVWFFVLRGSSSPFDGTWNAGAGGMGSIVISGSGDELKVKFIGADSSGTQKSYAVPAHMSGSDLVITVDDFVKASGSKAQASQARAVFEALIKDFRLVFTLQDPTHLKMTVEGTLASGQNPNPSQRSVVLTKAE